MAKVRVPQWNKPQGFHTLESDATRGAMVGRDLWWPDGSLVTYEQLSGGVGGGAAGDEYPITYWRLLMEVPVNVTALAQTSTTGFYVITGDGASATREIRGTAQQVSVSNGDGLGGNPTVSLSDLPDAGGGTLQRIERDVKGRISGTSEATTDDLPEGADNLYFTGERARSAAVADGIDPEVDDVAPSQRAVAEALASVIGEPGPPGKDGQIRFTGNGPPPTVILGANPGDTYMDLATGDVYKLT